MFQNTIGVEGLCVYVGRGKRESTFTCLHPGCCHDNRRVEECKLHGMFVATLELPLENMQTTFHWKPSPDFQD